MSKAELINSIGNMLRDKEEAEEAIKTVNREIVPMIINAGLNHCIKINWDALQRELGKKSK